MLRFIFSLFFFQKRSIIKIGQSLSEVNWVSYFDQYDRLDSFSD
jgi:hypothetical protein